jgi:hypothetical protein
VTEHTNTGIEETTTEKFELHANIAHSLIKHQGNSLRKAIMEAIMNSVDSKSTYVAVTITHDSVIVIDDGNGFTGLKEIDEFFSTIGTPHKAGDATFGRNRIGRLQLMEYGANTWRSNTFKMFADVKNRGLSHDVYDAEPQHRGCHIQLDLYDTLDQTEILGLCHGLKGAVEWLETEVRINGIVANKDKESIKWTLETPEAWILLNRSGYLKIYNMGVFVRHSYGDLIPAGGIIVSKKAIDLNAARNDISIQCPVWNTIVRDARKVLPRKVSPKKDSNRKWIHLHSDSEQAMYIADMISGKETLLSALEGEAGIIATAGREFGTLKQITHPLSNTIIIMPKKTPEGQMIVQSQLATVVLQKTLDCFGAKTGQELASLLMNMAENEIKKTKSNKLRTFIEAISKVRFCGASEFSSIFEHNYTEIPEEKLTTPHKRDLFIANIMSKLCAGRMKETCRTVKAGNSMTSQMWTDGKTIWIAEDQLSYTQPAKIMQCALQLIKNYCAQSLTTDSVDPAIEEATTFNEIATDDFLPGDMVKAALEYIIEDAGLKMKSSIGALTILSDFEDLCRSARA